MNTAHTAQHSLFTSAERIARAWLKNCSVICMRLKKSLPSGPRMSHPLLLSHRSWATSTSSSFTHPSTTTPEHAPQPGQHELLQEHPVHHQPLQERPVEKKRYQEPLDRENQLSGENPRNRFSEGYEPKELGTASRISSITDPKQLYDAQKEFGEQDHQAPITEEVKECRERTHGIPDYLSIDSEISETSYFQQHMHFDDSVESIADHDLDDGELQKMLTSPLYAQKASVRPDALGVLCSETLIRRI